MAINRVLNAIWAQLSAHGSLIKTATNPYNPNPGANTDGANNQGLAAINGGSPFLLLDQDGLSPEVPVATNLVNGANLSPAVGLDENSGAYHVTRQYGDIYLYNDGNVVAWGGNGKNFSFGNGYEENHAWANQPAVYNNERFTIPNRAMSPFTDPNTHALLPGPPTPSWEWLGGAVSKSWGNEYTYTYGSSYEWSSGPTKYVDAFGNTGDDLADLMQGKHCTFSYGNGYEEALIGWTNASTWFHVDDADSPYKGRSEDKWQTANMGFGWTADSLLVSKAFGNTYDYHYGAGLSVQEGPSEERVHGASWSTVTGNSYETVNGDSTSTVNGSSTSTVNGNSDETVHGDATSHTYGHNAEHHWGISNEYFMGGKSEMSLAACDEINLAATISIVAGGATEIFLGAKLELILAAAMEIKGGMGLSITAGANIEMNLGKVEVNDVASIDTATSGITASLLKLFL